MATHIGLLFESLFKLKSCDQFNNFSGDDIIMHLIMNPWLQKHAQNVAMATPEPETLS